MLGSKTSDAFNPASRKEPGTSRRRDPYIRREHEYIYVNIHPGRCVCWYAQFYTPRYVCVRFLHEFMSGERWSTKTLNWRKTGPARPKTASQSSTTLNCLPFSLAGHFGMSLSRVSPRLPRARRRLQRRRCARMATSRVVPLNLLAPLAGLLAAAQPALLFAGLLGGACRGPCWSPAHLMGCASPILALLYGCRC